MCMVVRHLPRQSCRFFPRVHARNVAGVEIDRLVEMLLANDVAKVIGAREGDEPRRDLVVRVGI